MLYHVIEDPAYEPIMFGLACSSGDCFHRLTADYAEIKALAKTCNRLELSPVHFYDIIEDFRIAKRNKLLIVLR